MSRGRKPSTPPEAKPLDNAAIASASRDLSIIGGQLQQIEERFGLAPYQRHRVIDEARFYMGQSAEAMLELGKRLLQMKEAEPHGEFMDCLSAIGVDYQTAKRVMRAAIKFEANGSTLTYLGRAKLYELAMLDDQDIKELSAGGTVAGLQLDDVDRMSVRELRAALRDARADKQAADDLLDKKNKKIDELDTKLTAKRKHALDPAAEARAAMSESTAAASNRIITAVGELEELLTDARAQGMHFHLPTWDAIQRGVLLAQTLLAELIGRHALIDPDSIPPDMFAPASTQTQQKQ